MWHHGRFSCYFIFAVEMREFLEASHNEMSDISADITRIRREMSTTREIVSRMHVQSASVEQLGPFLAPYQPQQSTGSEDLGSRAAASALGQSTAFLADQGRGAVGGSVNDLIRLGSVRSITKPKNRCDLPILNTFQSSRM